MINWDNLTILLYGSLGTAALLLIQGLASLLLPRFPAEVQDRLRHVQRATSSGEYQGDADIYSFDQALMEAELAQPGLTMRLYFSQPAERKLNHCDTFKLTLSYLYSPLNNPFTPWAYLRSNIG